MLGGNSAAAPVAAEPELPLPEAAPQEAVWDEARLAQAVIEINSRLQTVEVVVRQMGQQRALGEWQLERNTRAAALDLAIKARGPGASGDETVDTAEAFLAWLKAGTT